MDNRAVGASQYRKDGRLFSAPGAPDIVLSFAEQAIERWFPASAYVLDVCLSAGRPFIVEAQSFNSAGQYAVDLAPVIEAVNYVAVRDWNIAMENNLALTYKA